jgi:hypothetical protein
LKALAKRAADRYATAAELADDLANWQQGPTTQAIERTIIPKGLRSFDADDADFFLDLLPGPRDRSGLPASLRFWKTRIEARQSEQTFNVGLIYGPSGCGKLSLVKAGLIPRLRSLRVESDPDFAVASGLGKEDNLGTSSVDRFLRDCRCNAFPDYNPKMRFITLSLVVTGVANYFTAKITTRDSPKGLPRRSIVVDGKW